MRQLKSLSLLFAAVVLTSAVQAQVINGDLNHNDGLDVEDVTLLIDGYLTGAVELIDPYAVQNSSLVGTWCKSETESITFNADGTTDYIDGGTYKFRPFQGTVLFYDASGVPVSRLKIEEISSDYLVVATGIGNEVAVYTSAKPVQLVTSITLSQTTLNLQLDSDSVRLTATVLPSDAENTSVVWSSSDEDVAIVSSRGTVEVVGKGTAVITCMATDGSGVTATCEVTVSNTTPTPQPEETTTYTVNDVSFKMIFVAGGTFKMGAQKTDSSGPNYDREAVSDESPVHNVTLSDYSIGETEVTQALWKAVMGTNPSNRQGNNLPVEKVNWDDCQEFITKLNQATGKTFRLPTEAEWEFAARGGTKSKGYKYSGSNTVGNVAWYAENSDIKSHEVRTKQPNELGLYDMSGNVREWCSDWYASTYDSSDQSNPTGPTTGSDRVARGGYYTVANSSGCRVADRGHGTPTNRGGNTGLRLALSYSTK